MSKLTSLLYKTARLSADVDAVEGSVEEGSPAPVLNRVENHIVGRLMARTGIWRLLWRRR